ncbi:hypothetical protein B0H13DRAFT_1904767 [Mycena leptocephala]|nr:hypothetical protein B0H13DRAFT_1904767 [Mycena leptocephala]
MTCLENAGGGRTSPPPATNVFGGRSLPQAWCKIHLEFDFKQAHDTQHSQVRKAVVEARRGGAREEEELEELVDIGAIESVLSKDFAGGNAIVTGDDPKADDMSYIGPFWVSTVVAGLWGGEVWVTEADDTEKKIIGCAVWFGPGHTMTTSEDQQKYALGLLMAGFTYELKNWWMAALSNPYMYCGISPDFDYQLLPQYEVVLTSALGQGTKHSSWHLHTLAVDPEYQRKGAARSLVNAIVEKASQPGSMLCVEEGNETNVKRHFTGLLIYGKFGFEMMPKGKASDNFKAVYTGLDGNSFSMWSWRETK